MSKEIIVDGCDVSGCPSYMDNGECINENVYQDYCKACSNCTYKLEQQLDQLKAENEKMSKGYSELTEIVSPYIDDFTGYDEELGCFDIVLCIKELMCQLNQMREDREKAKNYNLEYGQLLIKATNKNNKLSKTLTEIKEIAENRKYYPCSYCIKKEILQKISEVEENE